MGSRWRVRLTLLSLLVLGTGLVLTSLTAVRAGDPSDYGDAPDPGYPSLDNTTSTAYPSRKGPCHLDVSQEWIGTSSASTTTLETDALLPDGDSDDGPIQLQRALVGGLPIAIGYVAVPVTISPSADSSTRYLNVVADLNSNGKWQAYPVGTSSQAEWIVANLAIVNRPGSSITEIVPFALDDTSVAPPYQIWVRATLTTEIIDPIVFGTNGWEGSGPAGGFARGETEDWLVSVADVSLFPSIPGRVPPAAPPPTPPPPPPPLPPGIPPDRGIQKLGVPDIPQRPYECGPTSAANSLYYLGETYGFADKLPQNTTDLIDMLKEAMRFEPNEGVTDSNFLDGKRNIAEKLGLPIETTSLSDGSYDATADFIMRELDRCEDVELGMSFTDADGGGHWVTVVGYAKYSDGTLRLTIHDPDDGLDGSVEYWVGRRGSYLSLLQYGRPNIVDIVVGESPVQKASVFPNSWVAVLAVLVSGVTAWTIRYRLGAKQAQAANRRHQ